MIFLGILTGILISGIFVWMMSRFEKPKIEEKEDDPLEIENEPWSLDPDWWRQ